MSLKFMSVKAYRATIWVSPLFLVAFQMAMVGAESASIHERRNAKLNEVRSLTNGPSRFRLPEVSPSMALP
ncbi:hypothetical protein LI138_13095 [Phocaeicola dorei]|uniref:Uncharacterized protein n=1 Tax=Phocaeicola vulgatus TaxID=821 RepID=A0AAW4UPJ2_PHOVU|nr:hypothetical protein [Phocaeicola vulgatus]MCB6463038.1 hypothetical protein [Phocaeicola dorei]MCB6277320.1 hypothetical protein [Phocaeicola vulgatus]MCB6289553.1 hypothetical protein [Phocaeicola vulgatus]MCB6495227.1 hypothetical protein [Phocaeicola vulgatus]